MKVHYRQSGGFGGLLMGCDLDTAEMPPRDAEELARLVKQAQLDKAASQRSPSGRDLLNHRISVDDDGHSSSASFDDMTVPSHVQPLLDFLTARITARPLDD
jgi:hypothetical protein